MTSIDVSNVIKDELTSLNEVCKANNFFKVNFIEANEAIIDEASEVLNDFNIFLAILNFVVATSFVFDFFAWRVRTCSCNLILFSNLILQRLYVKFSIFLIKRASSRSIFVFSFVLRVSFWTCSFIRRDFNTLLFWVNQLYFWASSIDAISYSLYNYFAIICETRFDWKHWHNKEDQERKIKVNKAKVIEADSATTISSEILKKANRWIIAVATEDANKVIEGVSRNWVLHAIELFIV